jgi:hypothetical protein
MPSVTGGSAIFNSHHANAAVHTASHDAQHSPLGLSSVAFSGTPAHASAAFSQTHEAGNTTVHLHDGSTITVLGASHVNVSFLHH